jgi:hypothetical protein
MKRTLTFRSYDDVLADAGNLAANGYERTGSWGLGQTCEHLARTMECSLDGFPSKAPWPVRLIARWFVLGRILKHRPLNRRFPAPNYLQPADAAEDRAGLERLTAAIQRLKGHSGTMHEHPVFGRVSPGEWREIHLWHSEHHIGFLTPKRNVTAQV